MSTINFKKNILLTGAGFTANFGGVLAREMWSKILNNKKIDQIPEAQKLLMDNFDFEDVYSQFVNNRNFPEEKRKILQEIVVESYASMDKTIKQFCNSGYRQYGVYWGGVSRFLALFAGNQAEPGVHFTLNQDVLLERGTQIHPLGFSATQYRDYWDSISSNQVDIEKLQTVPNESVLQEFISKNLSSWGDFFYAKLHGSQGWLSANGTSQMVLGTNKLDDINKEPILKWYFGLFQEALNRPDVKLFVIGYSFRDKHVNDLILKAVQEYKLKIYIISPEDPQKLKHRLEGRPEHSGGWEVLETKKIWEAVRGYFPYKLRDIFPADQTVTETFQDIKKIIES